MRDAVEGVSTEGGSVGQIFNGLETGRLSKSVGEMSSSIASRRAQIYTGPLGSLVALHRNAMRNRVKD